MLRWLPISLLLCFATAVHASEPLWLREPALSADGKQLLFTWQGRLFLSSANGGDATALTGSDYQSHSPVWSPDGHTIAFAANLYGNDDVYVMPARGGAMTRLTFDSGSDRPLAFSQDGKAVILSSQRPPLPRYDFYLPDTWNSATLYRAPLQGGHLTPYLPLPAQAIHQHGDQLIYQMPSADQPWRKHQNSFAVSRIWLMQGERQQQLSEDRIAASDPWWSADGRQVVYLSERSGNFNVWQRDLTSGEESQLTFYRQHPVRQLTMAANGDLAWSWNGELYRLPAGSTTPAKIVVNPLLGQEPDQSSESLTQVDDAVVNPTASEAVVVARGDLFAIDLANGRSRPLTRTPAEESEPHYLPDGRGILYLSERSGEAAIYTLKPASDAPLSAPGTLTDALLLHLPGHTISNPTLSPDGSWLAFVQDGQSVHLLDMVKHRQRELLGASFNPMRHQITLAFAPDSRHLALTLQPDSAQQEVAVIDIAANQPTPINVSQSGYLDEQPRWSDDGALLYWQSTQYGLLDADGEPLGRTLLGLYSSRAARADVLAERSAPESGYPFESDRLAYRQALQLPLPGVLLASRLHHGALLYLVEESPDGTHPVIKGYRYDLHKGQSEPLFDEQPGPALASLDAEANQAILIGDGQLTRINLDSGEATTQPFTLQQESRWQERMQASFEQIVRLTRSEFFSPDMNGTPWEQLVSAYRRFLPSISNPQDYATLLGELAGELNVSHTWGLPPASTSRHMDETASIGGYFEETPQGLRLQALLAGGPLDMESDLQVGDLLHAINDQPVSSLPQLDQVLNHQAGQPLQLHATHQGKPLNAVVEAISLTAEQTLLLKQWAEQRREQVHTLSQGRVGYVYLPEMSSQVYADVVADALGRERQKEALIVDVRFNQGGYLANTLVEFLSGNGERQGMASSWPQAGKGAPDAATRQWTKPSVVLANAASYSEGSAFTRYYQTLKLGPLVGEPIPGTGTMVYNHQSRLIPGLEYGIPTLALRTPDGAIYENHEQQPDQLVRYTPADQLAGRDPQLEAAVKAALAQLPKQMP